MPKRPEDRREPVVTDAALARRLEVAAKAAKLFDARGVDRVSMADVAAHVGLAKPSLYHYFKSKEEILYTIHVSLFEDMIARLERTIAATSDPWEQLRGIFADQLDMLARKPGHVRVFFEHFRQLDDPYRKSVREHQRRYERMVEGVLERGREQGIFRDIDPQLPALGLFGMVNWAHYWYSPRGRFQPAEIAEVFFAIFTGGMAANDG